MDNEASAFAQQMQDITPLKHEMRIRPHHRIDPCLAAARRQAACRTAGPTDGLIHWVQPDQSLNYRHPSLPGYRFAQWQDNLSLSQAQLDLHGYTLEHAQRQLSQFLVACQRRQIDSALVIPGQGPGGSPPALLKSHVNTWLRQRSDILAFTSAPPRLGGTGALYVLM